MRIIQVVTLLTPDNAFGGPVRVATNQLRMLAQQGHSVELWAGYRGYSVPPSVIDGVPVRAFPARKIVPGIGFAGLLAPAMLLALARESSRADVVHIHLARDLITMPAAQIVRYLSRPIVVQTHGMIDPSDKLLSIPLDLLWTRSTLRRAAAVLHLTAVERADLEAVCGRSANYVELPNGVPEAPQQPRTTDESRPIDVLFVARMHDTKRPMAFARAAAALAEDFPDATFSLVGPDEGEARNVLDFIRSNNLTGVLRWEGPLEPEHTLKRMARAAIFVNPRMREPFAMATLEAASVGLPLIITSTSGIADQVSAYSAGLLVGPAEGDLTAAIRQLLMNRSLAEEMGQNARRMAQEVFGMPNIVARLEEVYGKAVMQKVAQR